MFTWPVAVEVRLLLSVTVNVIVLLGVPNGAVQVDEFAADSGCRCSSRRRW